MELSFLGASQTVTGAKYLIQDAGKKIMVDCGLFQGIKELRQRNWEPLKINPKDLDAVILTHAHIDHAGYLPLLVKQGYKKSIYCSKGTTALCSILLPDAGHIQEEDARFANKKGFSKHTPAIPLYTKEDALNTLPYFHSLDFGKTYGLFDEFTISLHRAGHILGAAFVLFKNESTSILFSGDLGRNEDLLMNPPVKMSGADYVVIESTYGGKRHPTEDPVKIIRKLIISTAKRGGTVIIPSFAVGRTQTILYILYQLLSKKLIPDLPIFVDSPLANRATEIYLKHPNEYRLSKELLQDINGIATYVEAVEDSKALDDSRVPKIILAGSGMATGGRVLHHLAYHLHDPRNAVLFVGFQVPGTRGEKMIAGEKEIKIFGREYQVKAEVTFLDSLSAHADSGEILNWLKAFTHIPRKIYITHGEPEAAQALKYQIESELGWPAIIPAYLQTEVI